MNPPMYLLFSGSTFLIVTVFTLLIRDHSGSRSDFVKRIQGILFFLSFICPFFFNIFGSTSVFGKFKSCIRGQKYF